MSEAAHYVAACALCALALFFAGTAKASGVVFGCTFAIALLAALAAVYEARKGGG